MSITAFSKKKSQLTPKGILEEREMAVNKPAVIKGISAKRKLNVDLDTMPNDVAEELRQRIEKLEKILQ